jgi:glycosyltransferase involved in cell wall biosynthesis
MNRPTLTVIICTHNPRQDYLQRALAALRAQTLPVQEWELIVVDNASAQPVAVKFDLAWHRHARVVVEATLGLTPARRRGIREAAADLLVFVDDDNVLAPDFLAEAARLAATMPFLGAFGCSIRAVYEKPPAPEAREWVWLLTVGEITDNRWSNLGVLGGEVMTLPSGAGLVIRANVAQEYARLASTDTLRANLDRRGADLTGSGDRDLSATCGRLGLGTGKFASLKLDHLIPAGRLDPAYLIRLADATAYSETILYFLHGLTWKPQPISRTRRWLAAWERRHVSAFERAMHDAQQRGQARAVRLIESLSKNSAAPSAST